MKHMLFRLHRDERGLLSIANALLMLFLTIVLLCLFNSGAVLYDRTQSQQKADAVAQSLGNWKARNLNAVVAHQHLMGELLGMAIAHHAIGGDALDQNKVVDTRKLDADLERAYNLASISTLDKPAYSNVKAKVRAEAALYDARCKLKELLTYAYYAKFVGVVLQRYPPTAAAGYAMEIAAHGFEWLIYLESRVLKTIETRAKSLSARKVEILRVTLPAAKLQLEKMIADYENSQQDLVSQFEDKFKVKIHVMPKDRRLPLKLDPMAKLSAPPAGWRPPTDCDCPTESADNMRHQMVKVSQLSRATFPWVNYHRAPLIREMKLLAPLSGMGDHYFDHTAGYSKQLGDKLQRPDALKNLILYVLDDYQGPDKSMETWTRATGSGAADRTFGLTVVVGSPTRRPVGEFFFHATEGDYTYRIASALTWNRAAPIRPEHRIDLTCKRIVPSMQATTGWDTLNWRSGDPVPELVGFGIPDHFPAIAPQWTSSLTPTSAARIKQLQRTELPAWASRLPEVLPDRPTANEITL